MVFDIFKAILGLLKNYKVYVGVVPRRVPGPAVIIFPANDSMLCCGFAGIVAVKKANVPKDADSVAQVGDLWAKVRGYGLQTVLGGAVSPSDYLGGGRMEELEEHIRLLKTDEPFQRLFFAADKINRLKEIVEEMRIFLSREEELVEEKAGLFSTAVMETINGRLVSLRDAIWAIERDILRNVERIADLASAAEAGGISPSSLKKYKKINFLLNSLDRLEVRGRDSAGLHAAYTLAAPDAAGRARDVLKKKSLEDEFIKRARHGDLVDGSVCFSAIQGAEEGNIEGDAFLSFTYKTSSIVGELGVNTAKLRKSVREDRAFHALAGEEAVFDAAIVHTRWASVGSITEENCHPINNFTIPGRAASAADIVKNYPRYGEAAWTISAVLNGDIDNYHDLRDDLEKGGCLIAPEVTTDTKIIPLVIEKRLQAGEDLLTAFRLAVNDFEGSHAIAMMSNAEPGKVFLALKGSGQSLYVGIAPDQYVFSSEVYGLVEITPFFLKMDGETPRIPDLPDTAGQIFVLDQESPGGLEGVSAFFYDGAALNLLKEDVRKAEITTRDMDRGDYPHYFLKEISESALSVKKTLRGKYLIAEKGGNKSVVFNLGEDVLPAGLRASFTSGNIRRIFVIGHGTAAVAGEAIAASLERHLNGSSINIEAKIASELSGFCLSESLEDTLVIAVTQSGTTTDTNRAVAMALERGAAVVAIVNRRQSDITTKAHGVFYTSNGRDIEMSVASTKAFYSQIVAGNILSLCLAQLLKTQTDGFIAAELGVLEQAPGLMSRVMEKKEEIRRSAEGPARQKKYWAVVGSGPNKAAADEIRIKLSELCYRTISSDVVENKKHIDLSAEPLIIVCAAGSPDAVVGDIVKDAAIFKAHKAGVVVFADEGDERFYGIADAVIEIPRAPLPLSVILNTMAGHIWGYFAARSIDEDARFLREFRSRLNMAVMEQGRKNYTLYEKIADTQFRRLVGEFYPAFNRRRQNGAFTFLNVKTISDMMLLLKYAYGKLPLEDFWYEFPSSENLSSPVELLDLALAQAAEELTRPIDAIRHQAKTVTVGTSRKEPPPGGIIFDLLKELDFLTKSLTGKNILILSVLQPALAMIKGYTLYEISNLDGEGNPCESTSISIRKRGGISLQMRSRVEASGVLMGTKRTIVSTGHAYVGSGRADGASLVIIPLLEAGAVKNLLLLHVDFNEALPLREKIKVLGYRYSDIRNLINEYNLPWDDRCLETIPLAFLLGDPVEVVAEHIRQNANKCLGAGDDTA